MSANRQRISIELENLHVLNKIYNTFDLHCNSKISNEGVEYVFSTLNSHDISLHSSLVLDTGLLISEINVDFDLGILHKSTIFEKFIENLKEIHENGNGRTLQLLFSILYSLNCHYWQDICALLSRREFTKCVSLYSNLQHFYG